MVHSKFFFLSDGLFDIIEVILNIGGLSYELRKKRY